MDKLYSKSKIKTMCKDIKLDDKQITAAKEWLKLLDEGQLKKEQDNYLKFADIILRRILKYDISKDVDFEKGKKRKFIEFIFKNSNREIFCIEVKGTTTENLYERQHRKKKEHETPIEQLWNYMGSNALLYGICTNYRIFYLIDHDYGYYTPHKFDFKTIEEDEEKLKEFVAVFSNLLDEEIMKKNKKYQSMEQQELTNEFYSIYHDTRIMMIKEFEQKCNIIRKDAIRTAQLILNRLIFIFFVEDKQLIGESNLFSKNIRGVIENGITPESKNIWNYINDILFYKFNHGSSNNPKINEFNGGLFKDKINSHIYFSDQIDNDFFESIIKTQKSENWEFDPKLGNTIIDHKPSQIIKNLLKMASYDFDSQISVNILGHVFEQSITDLEVLKEGEISKTKLDGVYYTPDHITDYICKKAIISHLSKSGYVTSPFHLVAEYYDDLEILEQKFHNIKILDPACGSGAFLIKSVDVLILIWREIENIKILKKTGETEQQNITEYGEKDHIKEIIKNNIYGADINEESVEITKLSIFLKTASKGKKLPDLDNNIKVGNSIIPDISKNNFIWEKEFPNIFDDQNDEIGFDVVVGNPPYFNLRENDALNNSPDYNILKNGVVNVAALFLKKGIDLLNDGFLGFIIPKSFLTVESWKPIRDFIFKHSLIEVNDVGKQWDKVGLEQTIIFVSKNGKSDLTNVLTDFSHIDYIPQKVFEQRGIILTGLKLKGLELIQKIEKKSILIKDIAKTPRGVSVQSSIYLSESIANSVQVLGGTNIERYFIKNGSKRKPNRYLQSDHTKLKTKKIIFDMERIIYQNVASSVPKIVAMFENNGRPTDDTVNNLILNDDKYSYFDVLAILNSKLITFYLRYAIINNSTLTIHLDQSYVGQIPFKDPKGRFNELVKKILEYKYEINHKNSMFFSRLKEQFPNIKISKKIEMYHNLEFSELLIQLKKDKHTIPLKDRQEWQEYFEGIIPEVITLHDKTNTALSNIDDMVFDIYNITGDEKKFMLKSIEV